MLKRQPKHLTKGILSLSFLVFTAAGAQSDPGSDAHFLAQQFSDAHQTQQDPAPPKTDLLPEYVEGAFQNRKQESDIQTNDNLLDSIEARTKTIEDLLAKSTLKAWDAETFISEPATAPVSSVNLPPAKLASPALKPSNTTVAKQTWTPQPVAEPPGTTAVEPAKHTKSAKQNANQKDIYDLPEPSYALGGAGRLGSGLNAASQMMKRVTVLLKLEPGHSGIRRFKKTADPVLCARSYCYMSQGVERQALRQTRGATLGPFNTLGQRAGSCRQKLNCAFRDITLMQDGVLMQPVDLKILRHDRRAYRALSPDMTCRVQAGRLHCADPIIAKSWRAWIVPESIAEQAGLDGLATALEDGLPDRPIETQHVRHAQ